MKIRNVRDQDIEWITQSIEKEKWGYLASDVKGCFDLEPDGCFVAELKGQRVGHAFSINYSHFSWISLVIVDSRFRNQGIASSMMEKVLSYLDQNGPGTIFLEAVPEIAGLYRKFGFRDRFDSLRYLNPSISRQNNRANGIRRIQREDLEELIGFDRQYFGSPRPGVLRRFLNEYPDLCYLRKRNQKITGFVMARKTPKGYWIGPLTCNPDFSQDARPLMEASIRAMGSPVPEVRMGIPSVNPAASELASSMGFQKVGQSIRMVRGEEKGIGNILGIFGIGGPEKG